MQQGKLIVFSGPSGCGKSTVVAELCKKNPQMLPSISATTRAPRGAEEHGKEYFFLSREEFEAEIADDAFLEYAEVFGNYYGTKWRWLANEWEKGHWILLDIDVQGAMQIREKAGEALLIFIAPPSLDVLRQRLENRKTESEDKIAMRLAEAQREIEYSSKYDAVIVNDKLEETVLQIENILKQRFS